MIDITKLPAIGEHLDGGIFVGLTTTHNGDHVAATLLPGQGERMTWDQAKSWAKEAGGELPTRTVAALIYASQDARLSSEWHWTIEIEGSSWAWGWSFTNGAQHYIYRSSELVAVAVRLIPVI